MFDLSPLEKKFIQQNVNVLTRQMELDISYYDDSNWSAGYGSTSTGWSEYQKYWCSVNKVSELNIKEYPFGDLKTGDIILFFSKGTSLPKASKYKIKYQDREYISKTGLVEQTHLDTFLYYVMVGSL